MWKKICIGLILVIIVGTGSLVWTVKRAEQTFKIELASLKSEQIEKKVVIIDGEEAWYREEGTGVPILILAGWGGPTDPYFSLQDQLAEKGYKIILPDLPGLPGKTSSKLISLEEWNRWVDEFAKSVIGEQFVIISHSLSARIALRYISEKQEPRCLGGIFITPGFSSSFQTALCRFAGGIVRLFHLYPIIPEGMRWVMHEDVYQMALQLISPVQKREQPCVSSLILIGKRDPVKFFLTGWKEIKGAEIEENDWDHSPQIRAPEKLTTAIDNFIRRRLIVR